MNLSFPSRYCQYIALVPGADSGNYMQSCEFKADLGGKTLHALDGLIAVSTNRNIAFTATESVSLGLKMEQCPPDEDNLLFPFSHLLFCINCEAQKYN